jgi:hypothetical protein
MGKSDEGEEEGRIKKGMKVRRQGGSKKGGVKNGVQFDRRGVRIPGPVFVICRNGVI